MPDGEPNGPSSIPLAIPLAIRPHPPCPTWRTYLSKPNLTTTHIDDAR
jgi:hypothetical protein